MPATYRDNLEVHDYHVLGLHNHLMTFTCSDVACPKPADISKILIGIRSVIMYLKIILACLVRLLVGAVEGLSSFLSFVKL